jgi:hypothetical protein
MKAVAWMDTFNFILGVGTLWVLVVVLVVRNFDGGMVGGLRGHQERSGVCGQLRGAGCHRLLHHPRHHQPGPYRLGRHDCVAPHLFPLLHCKEQEEL